MQEWWASLDQLSQVLYCIAVPTSIILCIQIIMTIIGFGQGGPGINPDDISGLDGAGNTFDVDVSQTPDINTDFDASRTPDGGSPGDFGTMHLFTLEGIMAFLTVFGWTSIIAHNSGIGGTLAVLIGAALGAFAMFGVAKIIQLTSKLSYNGTLSLRNALGRTATVYLPIPANGAGQGKVNLTVQERFIEASAITDGTADLPRGALVRVVDIRSDDVLVVEKEQI